MAVRLSVLILALRNNAGNFTDTAKELGITRQGVSARVHKNPRLQDEMRNIDEMLKDAAENVVRYQIKQNDGPMARWLLDRKGSDRGYGRVGLDDNQFDKLIAALTPEELKNLADGN
jgi:hypothetical protein